MTMPLSLFERIWARHVIVPNPQGEELLYVDKNLVHEGGTFLAFDQMRTEGRTVRKPKQALAVTDHYLPSTNRATAPASIANANAPAILIDLPNRILPSDAASPNAGSTTISQMKFFSF